MGDTAALLALGADNGDQRFVGSGKFLVTSLTRCASWFRRCDIPPGASLLFGAVFGGPAPVGFGERAPESSGFKIPAVSRRSGLLPPGVVQTTAVDRVEAEIGDEAKHRAPGVRRIAGDRESYPPRRSLRNAFLKKA